LKKLITTLLSAACIAASPVGFTATQIIEVQGQVNDQAELNIRTAVDVVILRFDAPIPGLGNKIAEFEKNQAAGASYNTKDAAQFFSNSDQVFVEFEKGMADAAGNSGTLETWHRNGVPVTSVSDNGKTKTTTLKSEIVTTGASASVSISDLDAAHRAKVALKIHQIVQVSGTDVSRYFGDTKATLRGGQILPIFWTNNGTQYCAFLTLHTSDEKNPKRETRASVSFRE
jgi:hypothetical protein